MYSALWKKNGDQIHPSFMSVNARVVDLAAQLVFKKTYSNIGKAFGVGQSDEATFKAHLNTSLGVLTGFEIRLDGKKISAEVTNLGEALKQLDSHTAANIAKEANTQDPYLEEDFFMCRLTNLVQYQELEVIITYVTEMSMQGEYLYMVFPTSLSQTEEEQANNSSNNINIKPTEQIQQQQQSILNNSSNNNNSSIKQGLSIKLDLEMPSSIVEIKSPSHPDQIITKIGKNGEDSNFGSVEYEDTRPIDAANQNDLTILVKLKDPHEPAGFIERNQDGSHALMLVFYPRLSNNNNTTQQSPSTPTTQPTIDLATTSFAAAVQQQQLLQAPSSPLPTSGSNTPQKVYPLATSTQEMELIFLVDCSESMAGYNLNHAKKGLHLFCHSLPKSTFFNIISFGSTFKKLFAKSMQYGGENLEAATQYIKNLKSESGETNLLAPLQDIYNAPAVRPRKIFILTDGGVSNVGPIVELVRQNADNTSVFPIGMGEFGSRQLVDVVANAGCGVAELAIENETIENKVMRQLKRALQPAYTNIRIDWGTMSSKMQAPRDLRTLFDGDRLTVFNILSKDEKFNGTVKLLANGPNGPVSFQIQIKGDDVKQGDMIHCLAAYTLISDLQYQLLDTTDPAESDRLTKRIVELGIKYGLATNYTSFLAADDKDSPLPHNVLSESAMISLRGSASGIPTNMNQHHTTAQPQQQQQQASTISPLRQLSSTSPPFTPSTSNLSPSAPSFTPSTPLSKSTLKFNSPEFVPKSLQGGHPSIPFTIPAKLAPTTTPAPVAATPTPAPATTTTPVAAATSTPVAATTPAPVTSTPTPAPAVTTPAPIEATPTPAPAAVTPAPAAVTPTPAPVEATPTPAPAAVTPAPVVATPTPTPAPASPSKDNASVAPTTSTTTPAPAPSTTAAQPPAKAVAPAADSQASKIAAAIQAGLSQFGMVSNPTTSTAPPANIAAANSVSPPSGKKQYSIQFLLGQRYIDSNTLIPEKLKPYSSLLNQHQKPGAIFGQKENRRGKDRHHDNFKNQPAHPPAVPVKKIFSKDTAGEYSEIYKKFKFNLNRITMDTYATLIKTIEEITIPNEEVLKGVAKILFEKAIIDQKYSAVYAIMSGHLDVKFPKFENNITLKREVILNCQSVFEEKPDRSKFEALSKEDQEEQEFFIKRRTLGNIKFIGELYKHSVLAESIVIQCIKFLLGKAQESASEDIVEGVVKLITTIGKKLDADPTKPAIMTTFSTLLSISENEKFSSRARYLVLGLLDLRSERWEPKTTGMLKVNKDDHDKEERFIKAHGGRGGDRDDRDRERGRDRRGERRDRERERDRDDRRGGDRDSTPRKGGIFGKGSKSDGKSDGWEIAGKSPKDNNKKTPKKNELNSSSNSTPIKGGVTSPLRNSTSGTNKKDNQRQNMFSVLDDDDFPQGSPKKSQLEPTATPTPAKPDTNNEITTEKLEDTISMTLDEYVESRDVDEAIECLKELNYPNLYGKRDKEKDAVLELIHSLILSQMYTPENFKEGLKEVLDSIEDIEIDLPFASKFLAQVVGVCIEAEVFPLNYLEEAYIDLVDNGKAESMLKETFMAIENQADTDRLAELYEKTNNLDILKLFRPKNRNTQYLQEEFFQEYFPYLSTSKVVVSSDQSAEPTLSEHLILLQKADGYWELNKPLAGVISVPLSNLENAENSDSLSLTHPNIWATCLAYSFIQINFTEEQEDLELIKHKTLEWLNAEYEQPNPPTKPLDEILKKATRLISEY
ncbi:type A von Willebrand factor domain-containing protein [Heterostelium album PN500]|uniref:Type A von Willebrand factor domain-containing protein n=1 Tax=Heterostelium pallidum (strain ATCC 26659 / Pp 5 / PN500) TaxID=670386 RepID=D3B9P2_HETP5|nr:type A von Willebrand factor domain-containing protein [Heterostelium album PN500]EFA81954.1 type A von Willebrand factor domain-containing protein [Heterostelium album PN500]|eukprot:XP_020434071.1 type A von Willebrand factor domain-containing protein [Heterostelium album PN500]